MSKQQKGLPQHCLHEAAEWYWTIREADVADETIVEWQLWLAAAPDNRRAFEKIEAALDVVDGVDSPTWPTGEEIVADKYDGSIPVKEWNAQKPPENADGSDQGPATSNSGANYSRMLAMAATLLIAVAVGALLQYRPWSMAEQQPGYALYQTQRAEHREIVLPDGSTVALGGKSTISVAYHHDRRVVVLQNGEAYFDVVKDKSRLFTVEANGRDITAVGTAFNVSRQDVRVVVTVTEGTVIVAPESNMGVSGDAARLEVGQKLVYDDQEVMPISVADPGDAVAWRNGVLKYRGEPLRFVVEDVSRYIDYPIVLGDPTVGQLQFTGTVFQQSADTWVLGLPDAFPVVITETASGVVINLISESTN